jgi:hypothetical protein
LAAPSGGRGDGEPSTTCSSGDLPSSGDASKSTK